MKFYGAATPQHLVSILTEVENKSPDNDNSNENVNENGNENDNSN